MRICRVEGVVRRQIAGQTLLIPINQTGADLQKVYTLNDTGAAIWDAIASPISRDDLVANLASDYDAPESEIDAEVDGFVAELSERGFIVMEQGNE